MRVWHQLLLAAVKVPFLKLRLPASLDIDHVEEVGLEPLGNFLRSPNKLLSDPRERYRKY
jgi:hypothetical protein